MKGIVHFHSEHSFDSISSIDKILDHSMSLNLEFLILTDHDTVDGSIHLRQRIKERNLPLIAPIAAEYSTEDGDFISAFINEEIKFSSTEDLIGKTRAQDGIILLPHPFEGHSQKILNNVDKYCDLIETFNPRCSKEQNELSEKLALKFGISTFQGCDAHLLTEMKNVISISHPVANEEQLKNVLLESKFNCLTRDYTDKRLIYLSQMIKGLKTRNFRNIVKNLIKILVFSFKQKGT